MTIRKQTISFLVREDRFFRIWLGCAFFGFVCWAVPLREAFHFGGDERFELMKGLMCSRGFALYTQIWDDQPPLFTNLLSALFNAFGPSLLVARLMVLGFGTMLLVIFYGLALKTSGRLGAIAATLFLIVSPYYLKFSVSAMQEVPAIGTALLSAWALFKWDKQNKSGAWLLASGLIMGAALQIKLTAGMLVPAIMVAILLRSCMANGKITFRPACRNCAIWLFGNLISFAVIWLVCGGTGVQVLWRTHFSAALHAGMGDSTDQSFVFAQLHDHLEGLIGAALGIWFIYYRAQWREMAFPLVFFATSLGIHLFHRPYWDYYYLHLLVPMSWLSGHALAQLFTDASQLIRKREQKWPWSAIGFASVGIGLFLILILKGGQRLETDLNILVNEPRIQEDTILKKIIEYRDQTHWLYTSDNFYAFHAGLLVPPELTVVSAKRLWSGQISEPDIVKCVTRYQPEQLLLSFGLDRKPLWQDFMQSNYVSIYNTGSNVLFLRKNLLLRQPVAHP